MVPQDEENRPQIESKLASVNQEIAMQRKERRKTQRFYRKLNASAATKPARGKILCSIYLAIIISLLIKFGKNMHFKRFINETSLTNVPLTNIFFHFP